MKYIDALKDIQDTITDNDSLKDSIALKIDIINKDKTILK